MEALGFRINQTPFRLLANLPPYMTFHRHRNEPYETRVAVIEPSLMSASVLLPGLMSSPRKSQQERLARKSRRSRKLRFEEWTLFRVRPNNHPAQRIFGFARVLARSTVVGLTAVFKKAILQQNVSGVIEALEERPSIDRIRAQEMTVNVALSYLHSFGVISEDLQLGFVSQWVSVVEGLVTIRVRSEVRREYWRADRPAIHQNGEATARLVASSETFRGTYREF